jgi:ribosomal protein RSM22 (predicted rRNA methylase)
MSSKYAYLAVARAPPDAWAAAAAQRRAERVLERMAASPDRPDVSTPEEALEALRAAETDGDGHGDVEFAFPSRDNALDDEPMARVLGHPMKRKGLVIMDMCNADGDTERRIVTRGKLAKERAAFPGAFRAARKVVWGGLWPQALVHPRSEPAARGHGPSRRRGRE